MNKSSLAPLLFSMLILPLVFGGCSTGTPPLFTALDTPHVHIWDKKTHPFTGAAVIDVDGDGQFEVFLGGGQGQDDLLLDYQEGQLIDIIQGTGLSSKFATYGVRAMDLNQDRKTDLVLAREDGIHLYLNPSKGKAFEYRKIPVDLPHQSVPFDVAVGDIDRDGDADLYISTFVGFPFFKSATFNDPDHAKTNRLLLNTGDFNFKDITESSGTRRKNNSFCAAFVDLDQDGWQDLVVAQNTGEVEIFKNLRDTSFQSIPTHSGYGFWMGVGMGDVDSDGDTDLFFPNVGTSIPEFLTRGDIREDQPHTHDWLLLENQGNFKFKRATDQWIPKGEGFAWGGVFEDMDLDGHLDLFVAQNYIKWPFHKIFRLSGRAYAQAPKGQLPRFKPAPDWGLSNKYFGQSSLIVDLDGDGRQDDLWINMDGPLKAFINSSKAPFITLVLPDDLATLGTRVYLVTPFGKTYTRQVVDGSGYLTDQTPEITFGASQGALELVIEFPDGRKQIIPNPKVNTRIFLP